MNDKYACITHGGKPIALEGAVLITRHEYERLAAIEDRIREKIRQLEDPTYALTEPVHEAHRGAYVVALRFAIQRPYGEV